MNIDEIIKKLEEHKENGETDLVVDYWLASDIAENLNITNEEACKYTKLHESGGIPWEAIEDDYENYKKEEVSCAKS